MDSLHSQSENIHRRPVFEMSSAEILGLRDINGVHYKIYERRIRPSIIGVTQDLRKADEIDRQKILNRLPPKYGMSTIDSGLIGLYDDFRYVLATQAATREKLGASNKTVVNFLAMIQEGLAKGQKMFETITASGKKKTLEISSPLITFKTGIMSPIPISSTLTEDIYITDTETGDSAMASTIHPGLIKDYGFYEYVPGWDNLAQLLVVSGATDASLQEAQTVYDATKEEYGKKRQEEQKKREELMNDPRLNIVRESGLWYGTNCRTLEDWSAIIKDKKEMESLMVKARANSQAKTPSIYFTDLSKSWKPPSNRDIDLVDMISIKRIPKDNSQNNPSNWEKVEQYIENLKAQGVNFADEYNLHFLDKYDHFPGETTEEKYNTFDINYFDSMKK